MCNMCFACNASDHMQIDGFRARGYIREYRIFVQISNTFLIKFSVCCLHQHDRQWGSSETHPVACWQGRQNSKGAPKLIKSVS